MKKKTMLLVYVQLTNIEFARLISTVKQLTGQLCGGLTKKRDKQNNTATTTTTEKQSLLKPILGCSSQAQRIEIEFCGFSIIKIFSMHKYFGFSRKFGTKILL